MIGILHQQGMSFLQLHLPLYLHQHRQNGIFFITSPIHRNALEPEDAICYHRVRSGTSDRSRLVAQRLTCLLY